jgi:peptidoglycan/xylan/chitin deacetylase (PgdA/CDA1 family)
MAGVEIAAHTRTHVDLGQIHDEDRLVDEVLTAAKELETAIGRKVRYFAFPYGQFPNLNPRVFSMLREAGFLGVCSAYGGWNDVGSDAFHLQRIHGDPSFSRIRNWLTYDPRLGHVQRYDDSKSDHVTPQVPSEESPQAPEPVSVGLGLPVSEFQTPLTISQTTKPSC